MMVSDLDARITSQLALHRGLHTLAAPLMAMLREKMLNEKQQRENQKLPPSLEVAQALECIDRWCELAENVTMEQKSWT